MEEEQIQIQTIMTKVEIEIKSKDWLNIQCKQELENNIKIQMNKLNTSDTSKFTNKQRRWQNIYVERRKESI